MYANQTIDIQKNALKSILEMDENLYQIIKSVSNMNLPNLYAGGGSIDQSVWNHIFSKPAGYGISDVDIVYFDQDLSAEKEKEVTEKITEALKNQSYAIDVKNEARVHLWYEEVFGFPIKQYSSAEDAVSTWPSTATSIGVYFDKQNQFQVFAPYGMNDLFTGTLRPSKLMISKEVYDKKTAKWISKWPDLHVIPW